MCCLMGCFTQHASLLELLLPCLAQLQKSRQYPTPRLPLWNPAVLTILRQTSASVHLNTLSCSGTSTASLAEMLHTLCLPLPLPVCSLWQPVWHLLHYEAESQHKNNTEVCHSISNQFTSPRQGLHINLRPHTALCEHLNETSRTGIPSEIKDVFRARTRLTDVKSNETNVEFSSRNLLQICQIGSFFNRSCF